MSVDMIVSIQWHGVLFYLIYQKETICYPNLEYDDVADKFIICMILKTGCIITALLSNILCDYSSIYQIQSSVREKCRR